jgi:hypothetical protein
MEQQAVPQNTFQCSMAHIV